MKNAQNIYYICIVIEIPPQAGEFRRNDMLEIFTDIEYN